MDGIINVLKPPGMTSSDVVNWMRRILKIKKIGHTGTLDPGVAGVLPLCVGQATRVAEYLTAQGKAYRADITFGITTDTQDAYGNIINSCLPGDNLKEKLTGIVPEFVGEITQLPPMYSAVRKQGKRLYELARQGLDIPRTPRKVIVSKLEFLRWFDEEYPRAVLDVECSKGTYIRTLCHDIGERIGCGAHMSYLLRIRSGPFTLENSWTLEEIEEAVINGKLDFLLPIAAGLDMPEVILPEDRAVAFSNGLPTKSERVLGESKETGHVQVLTAGKLIGIGLWRSHELFPHKVFK